MARIRYIKPGLFSNEDLAELPIPARYLFSGLWVLADKEGRLEDRPKRIKAQVFPYDDIPFEQVEEWLSLLASAGFIVRYSIRGRFYIAMPTWHQHQRPHPRETPSVIPEPECNPEENREISKGEPKVSPECANSGGNEHGDEHENEYGVSASGDGASPLASDGEDIAWVQQALKDYMGGNYPREWGDPDEDIARKCLAVLGSRPITDLREALLVLHRRGRRPCKSWAFFPAVLNSFFTKEKGNGSNSKTI